MEKKITGELFCIPLTIFTILLFTAAAYGSDHGDFGFEHIDIPQVVVETFYGNYPENSNIMLDIRTGEFTLPLADLFKQRLLQDNYTILEREADEYIEISLTSYSTTRITEESRIFSQLTIRRDIHHFTYQVTSYPQGKVVSYKTIGVPSLAEEMREGLNWYDPLFISIIVGGLTYLLYFGS